MKSYESKKEKKALASDGKKKMAIAPEASGISPPLNPVLTQFIRQRLLVLDEYDREGENTTLFTRMTPDNEWIKMKDVHLNRSSEAFSSSSEDNTLNVPPAVFDQVRASQMAIQYLEQSINRNWTGHLEEKTTHFFADRMESTVQAMGQALADGMMALCRSTSSEDTGRLQTNALNNALKSVAEEVFSLLGPSGVTNLLSKQEHAEPESSLTDPATSSGQEKLTIQLVEQLKNATDSNPSLREGLENLTSEEINAFHKSKQDALMLVVDQLLHALGKSRRLRDAVENEGGDKLKSMSQDIVNTLEKTENTLSITISILQQSMPGMTKKLTTLKNVTSNAIADSSIRNYGLKKLQGFTKGSASLRGAIIQKKTDIDVSLFKVSNKYLLAPGGMEEEQKVELSTLMLPLDNAVEQIRAIARPLQDTAQQLVRVLGRDSRIEMNSDMLFQAAGVRINQPLSEASNSTTAVTDLFLQTVSGKSRMLDRLGHKVQQSRSNFVSLLETLTKLVPYLQDQLRTGHDNISTRLPGNSRYLSVTQSLYKDFEKSLMKLTTALTSAPKATGEGLIDLARKIAGEAKKIDSKAENMSHHIRIETAKILGIDFGYNLHLKNIVQDLVDFALEHGNGVPHKTQQIIDHLITSLSDPKRKILHRKNDPNNVMLISALKQELRNVQNNTQRKPPTVNELLAQTPSIKEAAYKKATQKTVSGLLSLGTSALTGGADVVSDVTQSALNAINPLRQALKPRNTLTLLQAYQGYNTEGNVKKLTLPGQRPREYASSKLLNRKAANLGLSAASLIPAPVALPFTAPFALHHALNRPEKFIGNVTSNLPMDITIAGGIQSFRAVGKVLTSVEREKINEIKRKLHTGIGLSGLDQNSYVVRRAIEEYIYEEVNEEKKSSRMKRSLADVVPSNESSEATFERNPALDEIVDKVLAEENPLSNDGGLLKGPVAWIKDMLARKLKEEGYNNPVDWNDIVEIGVNARRFGGDNVTLPDDHPHNKPYRTVTLLQYAMREHLRQRFGLTGTPVYRVKGMDNAQSQRLLDLLFNVDPQEEYIQAYREFNDRPGMTKYLAELNKAKIKKAIKNHFTFSLDDTFFNMDTVLKKIEDGDVNMIKLYGQKVSGMVAFEGENGQVLFVSLMTGRVFESRHSTTATGKLALKFKNNEEAQDFVDHVKFGLKYEHFIEHENYYKTIGDKSDYYNSDEDFKPSENGLVSIHPGSETQRPKLSGGGFMPIDNGYGNILTGRHRESYNPRIVLFKPEQDFAAELLDVQRTYALADADYLIKSDSEIFGDDIIDAVGILGTVIGVGLLPFTAGASGAAISVGGRILNFASSAAFSAALTGATGVAPKLIQSMYADREADAKAYILDAMGAILGEGLGYLGGKALDRVLSKIGKLINTVMENGLSREQIENYIKKRFASSQSSSLARTADTPSFSARTNSDEGFDATGSPTGSGTSGPSLSTGSDSYDSGIQMSSSHRSTRANAEQESILRVASDASANSTGRQAFGIRYQPNPSRILDIENALNYRYLTYQYVQMGYEVNVGTIRTLARNGDVSYRFVLKVSKPGMDPVFVHYKKAQGNVIGAPEVSSRAEFKSNYIRNESLQEHTVDVVWSNNFKINPLRTGSQSSVEQIYRSQWYKDEQLKKSLGSLTGDSPAAPATAAHSLEKTWHADKASGKPKNFDGGEASQSAVKGIPVAYNAVNRAGDVANSFKPDAPENIDKPQLVPPIYADAPKENRLVSTSLNGLYLARGNVFLLSGNQNNTVNSHDNSDMQGAVTEARKISSMINPVESKGRIESQNDSAWDRNVDKLSNEVTYRLGGAAENIDLRKLNVSLVMVIDHSRIPGYSGGKSLPNPVPIDAIIEVRVVGDTNRAQDVENILEAIIGRRIPVKVTEEISTGDELTLDKASQWLKQQKNAILKNPDKNDVKLHPAIKQLLINRGLPTDDILKNLSPKGDLLGESQLSWLIETIDAEMEADKPLSLTRAIHLLENIARHTNDLDGNYGINDGSRILPEKLLAFLNSLNIDTSNYLIDEGGYQLAKDAAISRGVKPDRAKFSMYGAHITLNRKAILGLINRLKALQNDSSRSE